jgi:L-2-hydroxyglutarate oxidase LhgO
VYPVPDPLLGGLGVHATLDAAGPIKFGPDAEWLPLARTVRDVDYTPDPERALSFYESIRRYWPNLRDGSLVPDYCGVRPKLSHPDLEIATGQTRRKSPPFRDFVVAGPKDHGVPGLVHLLGIESPGLTSALAIAEHVAMLLGDR